MLLLVGALTPAALSQHQRQRGFIYFLRKRKCRCQCSAAGRFL